MATFNRLILQEDNQKGPLTSKIHNTEVSSLRKDRIREAFMNPQKRKYCLENVATIDGIPYINHSISTNINSCWYAFENTSGPIIWIAGGMEKDNNYSILKEHVRKKVKLIITIGKNNQNLKNYFEKIIPEIVNARSMEESVYYSNLMAKKGDKVLFSPACASFDLFEDYKDRGKQFEKCVRGI